MRPSDALAWDAASEAQDSTRCSSWSTSGSTTTISGGAIQPALTLVRAPSLTNIFSARSASPETESPGPTRPELTLFSDPSAADAPAGKWGGEGRCKSELAVGDMGFYRLRCDLDDNHPELHWDRSLKVVWTEWTEADELANQSE